MYRTRFIPIVIGIILTAMVSPANSEQSAVNASGIPEDSIATRLPPGLADPAGARAALARRGITYGVNYIGEVLGVTSGGIMRGSKYDGRLEFVTDVNLDTLIGWRGLTFHANAYQIHGRSITAENVGSLAPVSFIEATPATRLFEVWFEQSLIDKRLSIRGGQLAADSEFMASEGGGAFIQGTFGWPTIAAEALPDGGPAYPLATPGIRVKITPTDKLTLMAAIFNGQVARPCASDDPQRCNRNGLQFPTGDPAFMMVEGAFKYDVVLPGTLKLGGWKHNGSFDSIRDDNAGGRLAVSAGTAAVLRGSHGLYAIIDQMLYRLPGTENKGVAMFARAIGTPGDRSLISLYFDGGLTFTGMLPGRPDDVLGIGIAYSRIGNAAREFDGDRNVANAISAPKRNHEAVMEVSYTAQIAPGWTIQPDAQYFWNPGGGGIDPDDDPTGTPRPASATVMGVRTTIKY